ncbi:MAG: molybdenum cofactor biosynthesis protein MoaE [Thermoprotei archaeon]
MIRKQAFRPGVYPKGSVDPYQLVSSINDDSGETGAIVTFIGVVKARGANGKKVAKVVMEAYDDVANQTIAKICEELVSKHHLTAAYIYHFVGEFSVGEPLVVIIVASNTRWNTYEAIQEAVRRYKTEPPIWKKEVYDDGTSEWLNE